jgi:hypothetical protein
MMAAMQMQMKEIIRINKISEITLKTEPPPEEESTSA